MAARAAFAELGIDASIEQIASRAGVGTGTLYRRFETKDALIDAVFEEHIDRVAGAAQRALGIDDPWQGMLSYLTETGVSRPPIAGSPRSSEPTSAASNSSDAPAPGCARSSSS